MLHKLTSRITKLPYEFLDMFYIPLDKYHIRRTKNISLIPTARRRRGGKYSYAEWAHVIGIFQTIINLHLDKKDNNTILDVGCGTGLLAIACEPFLGEEGHYVGIDVSNKDIQFCRNRYPSTKFSFIHLDINNPDYAPDQKAVHRQWNIDSESFDLVTALSVWTHLNEKDALFYIKEVHRALKPGGKAIVSFFILDELYAKCLAARGTDTSKYHNTKQSQWVFDQPAYDSKAWYYPKWARVAENAIGITRSGFEKLSAESGLKILASYPGNWKEIPGIFFQDVVVFQKK